MNPPAIALHFAQRVLFPGRTAAKPTDTETTTAILNELTLKKSLLSPAHASAILAGSRNRQLTAFIQMLATDAGIDAGLTDGFWGPQTQFAFDSLLYFEEHGLLPPNWRDETPMPLNPNSWPAQSESELIAFYGQPGDESKLVLVDVPYEHRLAWDLNTKVRRIRCHNKVADPLLRVLNKVKQRYGDDQIRQLRLDRFGGCYNQRRMRGGSAWSTHAWGIALDYDPDMNRLNWGRDKASFAKPEYNSWWQYWEEEGWVSLGKSANYDWMHVQAAKR
ncbi:MAG: hypothetical protein Q8S18_11405 [Bacteroidales bacterium]|nr:hypothetical protein [Bacteroidales bacterium]